MKRLFEVALLVSLLLCSCKSGSFLGAKKNEGTSKPASVVDVEKTGKGTLDDGRITKDAKLSMSVEERLMIDEINLVRKDPQAYISKVRDYMQAIRKDPSLSESYKHEEVSTARELIFELSRMGALEELIPHEGLYQTGIAHAKDVRKLATMSHVGIDGSYPWDRVSSMTDLSDGNENLVGGGKNIRESLIILLVDSDVSGRGHRLNILNPKWKYVAAHKIGVVGGVDNSWIQLFGGEPMEENGEGEMADSGNSRSSQPVNRGSSPRQEGVNNKVGSGMASAEKEKKKRTPFWKKDKKTDTNPPSTQKPSVENPPAKPATVDTKPAPASGSMNADFSFMKEEEKQMIQEINLMRSNPAGYISYVRTYIEEYKKAGWDASTTAEEIATADELIAELQKLSPLSLLKPHKKLHQVATIHGKDMQRSGQVVHVGSDGSHPYQRIRKATGLKDGNENLVGGGMSVRESVIMLLVDSGIANRGHRKTLLEPKWRYAACYKVGDVGMMPNTWVQNFATE